jgi:hypothetical protein
VAQTAPAKKKSQRKKQLNQLILLPLQLHLQSQLKRSKNLFAQLDSNPTLCRVFLWLTKKSPFRIIVLL